MAKKLWILTEERPKKDVLQIIIEEFKSLENVDLTIQDLKITPILDTSGNFTFEYELIGFSSDQVSQIKVFEHNQIRIHIDVWLKISLMMRMK